MIQPGRSKEMLRWRLNSLLNHSTQGPVILTGMEFAQETGYGELWADWDEALNRIDAVEPRMEHGVNTDGGSDGNESRMKGLHCSVTVLRCLLPDRTTGLSVSGRCSICGYRMLPAKESLAMGE